MSVTRKQFLARSAATVPAVLLASSSTARAAAALGSNAAQAASAATSIRVQLDWLKNVEFAGYWIAQSKGYYRAEKSNPTFLTGGASAPPSEAVVLGGQADVGIDPNLVSFMSAVEKGADLAIFASVFQTNPNGFLSLPKNPVRKASDLVGKRIGVAVSTGAEQDVDAIFKINGLPLNRTYVPVSFSPDPLLKGACDVMVAFITNEPVVLKAKGIPYVAVSFTDMNFPQYADFLFAKKSYIRANHDALVRFLRATIRGWQDNIADPGLGAQLAVNTYGKGLGLTYKEQLMENQAQIALMTNSLTRQKGLLWLSETELGGPMYKALRASGTKRLPDPASIIDTSILQAAYNGSNKIA